MEGVYMIGMIDMDNMQTSHTGTHAERIAFALELEILKPPPWHKFIYISVRQELLNETVALFRDPVFMGKRGLMPSSKINFHNGGPFMEGRVCIRVSLDPHAIEPESSYIDLR